MKLINNLDTKLWEAFIKTNPGISGVEFLLSPAWIEISKKEEERVETVAIVRQKDYRDQEIKLEDVLALALIIKRKIKGPWFYLYAPRGPLLAQGLDRKEKKAVINFFLKSVHRLYKKAIFFRIEPANEKSHRWQRHFPTWRLASLFRIKKVKSIQPEKTVVVDLSREPDKIIKSFKQKARYNIRLAQRKGVTVEAGSEADLDEFWRLLQATSKRDRFRLHNKEHYRQLLASSKPGFIELYFAYYKNKKIATAIVSFYGKKATYLHGASDNNYRQVMAPHYLQFELMKLARERNCLSYDLYGIDRQAWPGVTRFKLGFAGAEKRYPGTFAVIYRPRLYALYRSLHFIKNI